MYKEICKLYWPEIQSECIKHDWYTRGTNAEFYKLQDYVWDNAGDRNNLTPVKYAEVLQHIAEDILAHSRTEYSLADIMTVLAEKCFRYFVDVPED